MNRYQSVLGIHRTGPGEKRISDLEGDPSLGLVAAEKIALVDRVPVERVPVVRVVVEGVPFERVPSCHPVQAEHWEDSVCHLCVDPSQPLDER